MRIYKIAQEADYSAKYPIAGSEVDGLEVMSEIENMGSIEASLTDYYVLPGIRVVPMSDFGVNGKHYSVEGSNRISNLEKRIKYNKQIMPLIVVIDDEGPYILEGGSRINALFNLGIKHFPAIVVIDKENDENI